MKKYAVVITDEERTYVPKVILAESKDEAKEAMRKAYEAQLAEYEEMCLTIQDEDGFIEDAYATIEDTFAIIGLAEEVTYFDIVEVE